MDDLDLIDSLLASFAREFSVSEPRRHLREHINRAPLKCKGEVCRLLVAHAVEHACNAKRPLWIGHLLCDEIWEYRQQVCDGLTEALFKDDGALARRLGLLEFGSYRAISILGFGGFGTVFKAQCSKYPKSLVAVKVAHPGVEGARAALDDEQESFCRAAKVSQLPKIHEFAKNAAGLPYLAMEFIDGEPLDRWSQGHASLSVVLDVCRQLTVAIRGLHEAGCTHGDISPSNILISGSKTSPLVRIIDLGNSNFGFRVNRGIVCTANYAAPELLLRRTQKATPRTDMWSLGVVLFQLLAKQHPYGDLSRTTTVEELGRHFDTGPHVAMSHTLNLPPKFLETLLYCISEVPDRRLDARDLHAAIPATREYLGSPAAIKATTNEEPLPPPSSRLLPHLQTFRRWRWALATFVVATAIAAVLYYELGNTPENAMQFDMPEAKLTPPISTKNGAAAAVQAIASIPAEKTDREFTNSLGMKFKLIHPATFIMGSPPTEMNDFGPSAKHNGEEDQREVTLRRPIYFGVHHVTRGQFVRFVQSEGYVTDAQKQNAIRSGEMLATWQNPGFVQSDDHPVVAISWNDAVAFTQWLSRLEGKRYRLPLEAE